MKKLMMILAALLGTMSFVACSKKDKGTNNTECASGYVRVSDPQILSALGIGGGGNYGGGNYGGYNATGSYYVCVTEQQYQMACQQTGSCGGTNNCQMYPQAPGCQYYGGGGGNNQYCQMYPYAQGCQGYGGGGGYQDPYCLQYPWMCN